MYSRLLGREVIKLSCSTQSPLQGTQQPVILWKLTFEHMDTCLINKRTLEAFMVQWYIYLCKSGVVSLIPGFSSLWDEIRLWRSVRWPSGRASGVRGQGFDPHSDGSVVSMRDTFTSQKYW